MQKTKGLLLDFIQIFVFTFVFFMAIQTIPILISKTINKEKWGISEWGFVNTFVIFVGSQYI